MSNPIESVSTVHELNRKAAAVGREGGDGFVAPTASHGAVIAGDDGGKLMEAATGSGWWGANERDGDQGNEVDDRPVFPSGSHETVGAVADGGRPSNASPATGGWRATNRKRMEGKKNEEA